jgi:heme/copper-type cytochrome/quinol oxidase subunit 2
VGVTATGIGPEAGRIVDVHSNKARWALAVVAGVGLAFVFGGRVLSAAEKPIAVVMSRDRITPAQISARKGEPLHLAVTTADEEHCFAVDELRIEKRVRPGKTVAVEMAPDRAGRFSIYCCLESRESGPRGQLLVTE